MSITLRLHGTFERTVYNLLMADSLQTPKRCVTVIDGRVVTGHASAHRSQAGRAYNKLIRLHFRNKQQGVDQFRYDL